MFKQIKMQEKKGVGLGELLPAFVVVAAVMILVVLLIYVFGVLGGAFTANSAEANAAKDAVTHTSRAIPLVGILFIILAVGAVIAILVASLIGGKRRA
jgi:type II secretory pathway component PulF